MDKIDVSNLGLHFGQLTQNVIQAGDRYTQIDVQFAEDGLASGNLSTLSTPTLSLTDFRLNASRPLQLLDYAGSEELGSAFVLQGAMDSHFHERNQKVSFNGNRHNLQYNSNFVADHIIQAPAFHAISISYNLGYISELLQSDPTGPLAELHKHLEKKQDFLASKESLQFSVQMAEAIHAIRNCVFQGQTRFIYLEGKMLELFALQAAQLQSVFSGTTATDKWSGTDKEKLYAVRCFVENNYLEPLSLQELTRRFSLNEFKLKKGYKQFFKETVFGTIHRLKMQRAKELLLEKEMNVTDVSYFIGYENVSSFSTEFKKRFGYNPGSKN